MKALLLVASREEVSMAVEAFQKRVRSLVERPENLEKFAGFMEVHAAHEEAGRAAGPTPPLLRSTVFVGTDTSSY